MSFKSLAIVISFVFLCTLTAFSANQNNIQARVYFDNDDQRLELLSLHPDIVWTEKGYVEIVTNPAEISEIESHSLRVEMVIDDLEKYFISRLDPSRDMGGYMTLSEIYAKIDALVAGYPNIVYKVNIGQTIEGRDMWAVKISDNPDVEEAEEAEVLFAAAIHAREVITPLVLFNVMDSLTQRYATDSYIQDLVNNKEIWFIPCVNPDGYFHNEVIAPAGGGMWRKNRRDNGDGSFGIDINRNFGYNWGYDNVGSSPDGYDETYRGTGPFSEPESQNIRDFSIAHDFRIVVFYHAYSNLVLWPWEYVLATTPDEDLFIGLGDSVIAFNGYTPNYIDPLYEVNGGTSDWYYGEQTLKPKEFPFVIEIGYYEDNFWPPTYRINDLVNENYWSTLFLAEAADHIEIIGPPKAPVVTVPDTVDRAAYQVSWTHNDPYNPAVNYELVEYTNIQVTDYCNAADEFILDGFNIESYGRYHSEFSSLYGGAVNNSITHATTKNPIYVEAGDTFRFWAYYRIENGYDYGYVEISTDNINWTSLPGNITTNSNPNGLNLGNGITGLSGAWVYAEFDLSAYVSQAVYMRFSYHTNGSVLESGFFIDDIENITTNGNPVVVSSSISNTYYDLTDRVANSDYYYAVRAQDAEGQWGDLSEVVKTFAMSPWVCGDIDGVEGINVLDIVYLINYLYKGGTTPDPLESADVDHISPVNILDIVYMINFVYKGGSDPNCP